MTRQRKSINTEVELARFQNLRIDDGGIKTPTASRGRTRGKEGDHQNNVKQFMIYTFDFWFFLEDHKEHVHEFEKLLEGLSVNKSLVYAKKIAGRIPAVFISVSSEERPKDIRDEIITFLQDCGLRAENGAKNVRVIKPNNSLNEDAECWPHVLKNHLYRGPRFKETYFYQGNKSKFINVVGVTAVLVMDDRIYYLLAKSKRKGDWKFFSGRPQLNDRDYFHTVAREMMEETYGYQLFSNVNELAKYFREHAFFTRQCFVKLKRIGGVLSFMVNLTPFILHNTERYPCGMLTKENFGDVVIEDLRSCMQENQEQLKDGKSCHKDPGVFYEEMCDYKLVPLQQLYLPTGGINRNLGISWNYTDGTRTWDSTVEELKSTFAKTKIELPDKFYEKPILEPGSP